jgi:gliding motility-associated-like protein
LQSSSTTPSVRYAWTGPSVVIGAATDTPTVNQPGWYYLTVTDNLNGCTSKDSVQVNIDTVKPNIIITVDKNPLCPDEIATFTATSTLSSYQWHSNNISIIANDSKTFEAAISGIYFVKAAAINGCIGQSNAIQLIHLPKPDISLQALSNANICEGDSMRIFTDSGFSKYSWWFTNSIYRNTTQNFTYVKDSGSYHVSVTNEAGCSDTSNQLSIGIDKDFEINFGEEVSICKNKTLTINPGINNADSYLWNTGEISPTISVQNIGNYAVSIKRGGCNHEGSIFVTYAGEIPDFTFGDDIIGCLKKDVILSAPENYAYVWGDSSIDAQKIIEEPGIYTIAVSNKCGTIYDTVAVTFDTCECDIYVPTAFSPNANALNDYFIPINECNTTYTLQIYNRWGIEVYKGSQTDLGWDGTYQNEWQPQDSYIYILSYYDRYKKTMIQHKGVFVLIR